MTAEGPGPGWGRGECAGFTLIELMIVIAVVAILVATAVASYEFATTKTRRATAKGCLSEAAQYMERFHTTNMRYDQTSTGGAVTLPGCSTDVTTFYTIGFAADQPTNSTFGLEAVPQGSQANSDTRCGTLTLDHTGRRSAGDNTDAAIRYCW